jgi:hypothetical protein
LFHHFGKVNPVPVGQLIVHEAKIKRPFAAQSERRAQTGGTRQAQLACLSLQQLADTFKVCIAVFNGKNLKRPREDHRSRLWNAGGKILGRGHSHLLEDTVDLMRRADNVIDDRH